MYHPGMERGSPEGTEGKGAAPKRRNFVGSGNDPFSCLACGHDVLPLAGGFRSHCPECLWSLHVDEVPGDRQARCGGLMRPVAVEKNHATWYVVHICELCGARKRNRLALSDPRQPDSWDRVIELSSPEPE